LRRLSSLPLQAIALFILASGTLVFAGTITGTVTNKTTGKPAAGDNVSLLSLASAMDEVGSAKTDSAGHFKLTTPSEAPYLIKVEHQKGAYFKNMPPGATTADIAVYDVATKVEGVSTEADVMRVETEAGQLKVVENYFVRNQSSPPRTQSSEHTFEVVLPPDATLESAATVGPSNMPLAATPDPVSPKGHYAFSFPIRPNEGEMGTRFQLSYHVPYSGSYKFTTSLMENVENLVVMMPKSMKLAAGKGASFQPVPDDASGQTMLMKNVAAGQPVEFTVSGTGSLPRDAEPASGGGSAGMGAGGAQAGDDSAAPNGPNGKPGGGLGNPIGTDDPISKYKYWYLAGLVLVLVIAAAFLLRKPSGQVAGLAPMLVTGQVVGHALSASSAPKSQLLLDALKEELFAIESEKVAGKLSADEYGHIKAALEIVLKRALARQHS